MIVSFLVNLGLRELIARYGPTAGLALIVSVGGWWLYQSVTTRHYDAGFAASEATWAARVDAANQRLFEAAEQHSRDVARLAAFEADQSRRQEEHENAARSDPDGLRPGISGTTMGPRPLISAYRPSTAASAKTACTRPMWRVGGRVWLIRKCSSGTWVMR